MTTFPPLSGDAGATNTPIPNPGAIGSGNDDSGDLRAELVALLHRPYDGSWSLPTRTHAEGIADAILAAGWRRVSVDDDTVERVAAVLAECDGYAWPGVDGELRSDADYDLDRAEARPGYYLNRARAAVQALRDGGTDA